MCLVSQLQSNLTKLKNKTIENKIHNNKHAKRNIFHSCIVDVTM